MSQNFWEGAMAKLLETWGVFVSSDTTPIDESLEQPPFVSEAGALLTLPTVAADDMPLDWCRGVKGTEVAETVHQAVREIRRIGTTQAGMPAVVEDLPAPLVVDGLDEFEVVVLLEGRNYGAPREDFET
ncbi:hypothetical protein ACFT2C_05360 [Promicromonospora sp. NPDC057138]|uniref:hypothetical protein n=1 Tax=Promicromonospora sp. NPDC057138 TaxID=3346031 RepID=UPI0036262B6D